MFVEYALRLSASAISSVAATSAFRITSKVIGSSGSRSRPSGTSLRALRRVYRDHPYTSRARSALTLPSRTSRTTSAGSRSAGGP